MKRLDGRTERGKKGGGGFLGFGWVFVVVVVGGFFFF